MEDGLPVLLAFDPLLELACRVIVSVTVLCGIFKRRAIASWVLPAIRKPIIFPRSNSFNSRLFPMSNGAVLKKEECLRFCLLKLIYALLREYKHMYLIVRTRGFI
jgi:hypothetical protein